MPKQRWDLWGAAGVVIRGVLLRRRCTVLHARTGMAVTPSWMFRPPSRGAAKRPPSLDAPSPSSPAQVPPGALPARPTAGAGRELWQGLRGAALAARAGSPGLLPGALLTKQKRLGRGASEANSSFLFPELCCLPAAFACKQ